MDVRRVFISGLVVFSVVSAGCSSKTGDSRQLARSGSDESAAGSFGDARYQDLVRDMEKNGSSTAFGAEPKSTTEKIGGAIKKASATVTGALTMKPKVIKAPDPLALDNVPKNIGIDLYYQSGRLAESSGNAAAAIEQYERGLKEQPKHLPTLISLARLYDRQDEFDKAQKLYRRALEAEPDNAMAHNDLGLCLARHDRSDEAIAALRQAVKLEPSRKLYRNNLATVLVDLGQVDAAYTELSAAHPAAVAHYNLGYLLYHAGNKSRAHEEFTLARQADSSLVDAQQMLDQLDAETKRVTKTELAKAPAAPSKVQCRVEDLTPQPTRVANRTQSLPVAMVHSPPELRRIPAADPTAEAAPAPAPAKPSGEPVPWTPAGGATPLPADSSTAAPPSGEFPIRTMSGSLVDDSEPLELPTPDLLNDLQPANHAPGLISDPALPIAP
ncbi:MAG: tetratricopeptide repeat protein [Pirellulaceae bacterium]